MNLIKSEESHTVSNKSSSKKDIYGYIYRNGAVSRQEIVRNLTLSLPTVNHWITQLLNEGLIVPAGNAHNTGGRSAQLFSVVNDIRVAIGVEISKHHITIVLVDILGNIISTHKQELGFLCADTYYDSVGKAINKLVQENHIPEGKILGVGIGVPGLVSQDGTKVIHSKILDMSNMTVRDFERHISYPCRLYNDAKAAGFAELWYRSIKRAFYVLLSYHVGGALLINNQVCFGDFTRAGEFGHQQIIPNGKKCYCGQTGCVDPYCSLSSLTDAVNGDIEEFFASLRKGNSAARRAWNEYISYLSIAIHNVVMILDCPVIIGGRVGANVEEFIDDINEAVNRLHPFTEDSNMVRSCCCKKEAIASGSTFPFINQFLHQI